MVVRESCRRKDGDRRRRIIRFKNIEPFKSLINNSKRLKLFCFDDLLVEPSLYFVLFDRWQFLMVVVEMSTRRLARTAAVKFRFPYRFNCSNVICILLATIVQGSRRRIPSPQNISGIRALCSLLRPRIGPHLAEIPASSNRVQHQVTGLLLEEKKCFPSSLMRLCCLVERPEMIDAPEGEVPKIFRSQESSRLPAFGQTWQTTIEVRSIFSDLCKTSSRYALPWMPAVGNLPPTSEARVSFCLPTDAACCGCAS